MRSGGSVTCTEGGELVKTPAPPESNKPETKDEPAKAGSVVSGSTKPTRAAGKVSTPDTLSE